MSEKLLRNDNGDLKELTDGQLAYAADLILRDFASSQSGVGTLVVSPNALAGTSIGTFIDTKRSVAVGTHPVDGTEITSTTYTFRQDLSSVDTSSVVRPVKYKIPADAVTSYSLTSTDYEVLGEYDVVGDVILDSNAGGSLLSFTVSINWDAVSGATGYTLNIDNGGSGWNGGGTRYMIKVLGSELGGKDGVNDLYVIARRQSGGLGNITQMTVSTSNNYTTQKPQARNFDIAEMTDTNLTATLIGKCLTTLTAGGIGSYVLQPSAPTNGTWTEILTINNLTQTSTNSTKLWRKTSDTAVSAFSLPLKLDTNADLQEMTTTEVRALSTVLRKAIVDTGRGTYALSTSAPAGGTWVRVGQAFKDTRQKIGAQSFVLAGGYSGAGYSKNYIGTYNKVYSKNYVKDYSGPLYSRLYVDEDKLIATYSKTYTGTYSRVTRTASYTGNYLGIIRKDYVGTRSYRRTFGSRQAAYYTSAAQTFSSYFNRYYNRTSNQSFSTEFSGDYVKAYGRNAAVSYENQYLGSYKTIAYAKGYVRTYENAGYQKEYIANFVGSYSGNTILSEQEDVSEVSLWVRVA